MSDYSKSVIYMIKKKDDDDNENVYIGSTNNFTRRKHQHKSNCNNPNRKQHNLKVYQYIRDNGGWDEWIMDVILNYPCDSREELEEREDIIMCEIKSVLNNNRAKRSIKEYRIDNRDKLAEQMKQYYEVNKDKVLEQTKEYYENNCDKIKEYHKKWYKNNIDKIAEKRSEKIKCDICGCEISKGNLLTHKKSLKCKNYNK